MLSILPDDVIIEILKRLPVKSLVRLKLLNKTWCHIIESPMFIKSHFHHQQSVPRENQKICVVSIQALFKRGGTLIGIDECGYDFSVGCTTEKIAELHYPKMGATCYYIGSNNGLIGIGVQELSPYTEIVESIIIWNPSTRKSNIIPATKIFRPFEPRRDEWFWSACVYGFSYVSSIDDYKVVRIYYPYDRCHPRLEVFSVKTNRWSMDDLAIPNDYPLMDKRQDKQLRQHAVVVNEVMYYKTTEYANDGMELSNKIRCFDLGSECFLKELVSVPPGLEHWQNDDLLLAELGGVLCCICCKKKFVPSRSFEIWKKGGGVGWSKMISIPFCEWSTREFIPICLTSHARWMMKTDEDNGGRGECLIVSDGINFYELDMSTGRKEFFYKLNDWDEKLKGWKHKIFLFDKETLISPRA